MTDIPIITGEDRPEIDAQTTFADLGVHPDIVKALVEVGIVHPFPIQALSLPIALSGTDMIGQARTGTGKTLAFGISTLQRTLIEGDDEFEEWEHPGKPQALILCPTRELALQVSRDLQTASKYRQVRVLTVYGGVGYEPQLEALERGVDVVVGTPGRVLDLMQRGSLNLKFVRIAVLDEADEMLDLGFLPDVERLLGQTPKDRQTLLFSATMPSAIASLARSHLSHPVNIRAEAHDAQATVPDTTQHVFQAHDLDKPEIIGKLLQSPDCTKSIIFCRTKRACQRLADELEDRGFRSAAIHGDLSQDGRERALKKFRKDEIDVLVATDVAARGIDVKGVSHVINNECPEDDKAYVHRIGRTGRAGHKGIAVTFVDWADLVRWKTINKTLDLGFDNPPESYSTTPELLTALNIPEGTKGRIPGSVPKDRPPREDRGRGGRDGGRGGRDGGRGGRDGGRGGRDGGRGGRDGGSRESRPSTGPETDEGVERPREPRRRTSRTRRRTRNGVELGKDDAGTQG